MSADAQSLLASSSCYACYASSGVMLQLLKLALLRRWLLTLSGSADVTPAALLASVNCLQCTGDLNLMRLALWAQIATNTVSSTGVRVTDEGDVRVTDTGDRRVTA